MENSQFEFRNKYFTDFCSDRGRYIVNITIIAIIVNTNKFLAQTQGRIQEILALILSQIIEYGIKKIR